jgi:uncharacterized protein (DUF2147 family)
MMMLRVLRHLLRLGCAAALFAAASAPVFAQGAELILGRWLTSNREGVVEIFHCADKLCGRLVWLRQPLDSNGKPKTDIRNTKTELRSRQLCGVMLLGDFQPRGNQEWDGGCIYSPQKGETYDASMRLEGEGVPKLHVGGALFGQTQTWTRADPNLPACTGG